MTAAAVEGRGYIRPELEHLATPITTITTYPGNARRGDHHRIRDSLLTHGQYKPLLAQRTTGHLVVGNNTLQVMRTQGWTHAAVVYLDLDDTAARKLLLMDNRSSDTADYDTGELAELLATLPEFAGSGYGELDLDRLLAELGDGAALDSLPDVTEALPVSPAGPRLPDVATADPPPNPTPPPAPPAPPALPPVTDQVRPARASAHTATPPTPAAAPPPGSRPPTPPPDADVPFHLTLTRTDREEALRLIAHARDWLDDPGLPPGEVVMRALRTLAAIGDARHNPTTTINITTLLMAAGRDPFRSL